MFLPKNQFFKSPVALFSVIALLCISVLAAFIAAESSQDIRNRASTATGAVEVMLNPANGTYFGTEAGTKRSITLTTNTFTEKTTGYELFLDFTGTIPSDLAFTPADRTDISVVTSDFSTTANGKRLTLGLLPPIANPPKSFSTNGNAVTLGTLTYTTPSSGQMSAIFDPTLSRVLRFNADPTQTAEVDVLRKQTGAFSYTFGLSTSPSPRPSSTPSSILSNPSITPSPVVCFNRVVVSGSRLYWPDGCKGSPAVSMCIQVVTELTAAEKTAYQQWVSAGKPLSAACTPKNTPAPTARPTAPPGCVYQAVECIQAPCDPILVCSTPKPNPTYIPTPSPARTCASQGGYCRPKSGVCGDGAHVFVSSSDCASTDYCCVPVSTPIGYPVPSPLPVETPTANNPYGVFVQLLNPNGGTNYTLDSSVIPVTWNFDTAGRSIEGASVRATLSLTDTRGKPVQQIATTPVVAGKNSYRWVVSGVIPGTYRMQVKLSSPLTDITLEDLSDKTFTVVRTNSGTGTFSPPTSPRETVPFWERLRSLWSSFQRK